MKHADRVFDLLRKQGILRPRDLKPYGISADYLYELHRQGKVIRIGRGLYCLPDMDFTESHSFAEASKRVPHGVVCLLSALRFHDLTTQAPFEIWLAIDRKARLPKVGTLPLHIVRFSGEALSSGIEEHEIEGVEVKIYSPAKTVADCFKYRNKIGIDVALEALQDCRRERKCTVDDLWHYAKICRVANVIKPYLEAIS